MKRFAITAMALLVTLALAASAFAEPRGFSENPGGPSTSVLSNQVELYHYIPSGLCYDAWTGGVKLRNAVAPAGGGAAGTITVPALVAAGQANAQLIWVILDDVVPPATETFNGFALARIPIGPVTDSPCWPQVNAYAYRADVTGLVVPGVNTLAGFPDTGVISAGSNTEGATLVVAHSTSGVDKELILTVGNDLLETSTASLALAPVGAAGTGAELVFIGADGQVADDTVSWNGVSLAGPDAWLGLDPGPGVGYWDTMEFGVTIGGANLAESTGGPDCINWVATLLKVKSGGCQTVGTEESTWGGVKSIFR
jgi:hypothetical protein